jgi:hypothetical protein
LGKFDRCPTYLKLESSSGQLRQNMRFRFAKTSCRCQNF